MLHELSVAIVRSPMATDHLPADDRSLFQPQGRALYPTARCCRDEIPRRKYIHSFIHSFASSSPSHITHPHSHPYYPSTPSHLASSALWRLRPANTARAVQTVELRFTAAATAVGVIGKNFGAKRKRVTNPGRANAPRVLQVRLKWCKLLCVCVCVPVSAFVSMVMRARAPTQSRSVHNKERKIGAGPADCSRTSRRRVSLCNPRPSLPFVMFVPSP